jgi:hypothetical protein
MKKIQFDCLHGIYEVEEFDEGVFHCGIYTDDLNVDEFLFWFTKEFEGTRALEVSEKVYNCLDITLGYGIKKI